MIKGADNSSRDDLQLHLDKIADLPKEIALSVKDIGKCYRLYKTPGERLKEQVLSVFGKQYGKEFWALNKVSFNVNKGETFGIIGRNGSGKSTLMQIIANVLKPSQGEIFVNGKVAALLELGSGFNPEYTGRENVYLNGAVLGISNKEMEACFQDIIEFAEIGDFIDQPVKSYSSGMFVRLAFAVTTSVNADILLIDEALAVGDVFFRQKCYKRLEDLRKKGTSIILVTHAMGEVEQFCQRTLILDKGNQLFVGNSSEAVKRYYLLEQRERISKQENKNTSTIVEGIGEEPEHSLADENNATNFFWPEPDAFFELTNSVEVSNSWARCTGVALCNKEGEACRVFTQGEKAVFYYEFELLQEIEVPIGGLVIYNDKNLIIHGKNTLQYGTAVPQKVQKNSRLRFCQEIQLNLHEGDFTYEVGLATMSAADYKIRKQMSYSELNATNIRLCHRPAAGYFTIVLSKGGKIGELLHHGICDLPGQCEIQLN